MSQWFDCYDVRGTRIQLATYSSGILIATYTEDWYDRRYDYEPQSYDICVDFHTMIDDVQHSQFVMYRSFREYADAELMWNTIIQHSPDLIYKFWNEGDDFGPSR